MKGRSKPAKPGKASDQAPGGAGDGAAPPVGCHRIVKTSPKIPGKETGQTLDVLPQEIIEKLEAGDYWEPQDLTSFMAIRAGDVIGVQEMAAELRYYAEKLDTSDDKVLADHLLGLTRAMVDRLNWLAQAGKLGDAPRGHETWPMNYAPDAGTGASGWVPANELYRKLRCGEGGVIPRVAGQLGYDNRWTQLAEAGVRAALLAKKKAAWVDEQTKNYKLCITRKDKHKATVIEGDYYLCRDGRVIVWPAWAQRCRHLPDTLDAGNWTAFVPVLRQLVLIYLLEDEKRALEYLQAAAGRKCSVTKWNADVFNHKLIKSLKGTLESMASRRE